MSETDEETLIRQMDRTIELTKAIVGRCSLCDFDKLEEDKIPIIDCTFDICSLHKWRRKK